MNDPTALADPTDILPISEVYAPESVEELQSIVKMAAGQRLAVYPIGGGTSLQYGLPAKEQGIGVSLANLSQVIDYPAEDMTITVGAGVTISDLAKTLAANRQRLPLDVPQSHAATLGGVVAANVSGPRRYGRGTMRDHIIGIQAVDARGELFKGGGRVVKNVAGYDFCRLLTGSMGTLGVISQVTLKLSPMVAETRVVACELRKWEQAERLLAALVESATTPVAIELVAGPEWDSLLDEPESADGRVAYLLVGLEGTKVEVEWMERTLADEWASLDTQVSATFSNSGDERFQADELWSRLTEFPTEPAALVLKATTLPSAVTKFADAALQMDAKCSLQSHAGNGVTILRYADYPEEGLSRLLLSKLVPLAAESGGNVTVLSNPTSSESTKQSVWGGIDAPFDLMTAIKNKFDPQNLLNPGRFVYA